MAWTSSIPLITTFLHYNDLRVGSLAFAPDGSLWAVTWPKNQNSIIKFVDDCINARPVCRNIHPQLMLQFNTNIDSIAFGVPGSALNGLLFVTHDQGPQRGAGTELTMIDWATLQQVALATGGSRGDEIRTTADGRVLISQSMQVDVLNPIRAPRVANTNPPPGSLVPQPFGSLSVTFDSDMFVGDPSDPHSVLNPANYQLTGDNAGPIRIQSVSFDQFSRTATLNFDSLDADHYLVQVLTGVQNTSGLALAQVYSGDFKAIEDFSPLVKIAFLRRPRGQRRAHGFV